VKPAVLTVWKTISLFMTWVMKTVEGGWRLESKLCLKAYSMILLQCKTL